MMKDFLEKTDKYKAYGLLLAGTGGYVIARRKGFNKYEQAMIVMVLASFGMLLPDVIDGVRGENKTRLRQMTSQSGSDLAQFAKDYWVALAIGAALIYFLLKKEKLEKKQLLFLVVFYIAFVFFLKDTVPLKKKESEGEGMGLSVFPAHLDAEFVLFGVALASLLAYSRTDRSIKKYLLYALLGAGGGFGLSYLIRSNIKLDEVSGYTGQERQIREKRLHSRILLLSIGKGVAKNDKKNALGEKLDIFIDGLNEKELITLDKIYETQKDAIERGQGLDYDKIANDLRSKNLGQKTVDTFLQTVNSFINFLTGEYIALDSFGEDRTFKVNNTIHEFSLDDKGYLQNTGKKFRSGDEIKGKERWVWVNNKIGNENIRKQIRMVQLDGNNYVMFVGVERK